MVKYGKIETGNDISDGRPAKAPFCERNAQNGLFPFPKDAFSAAMAQALLHVPPGR